MRNTDFRENCIVSRNVYSVLITLGLFAGLPAAIVCGGSPPVLPIQLGPQTAGAESGAALLARHGMVPDGVGFLLYDMEAGAVLAAHGRDRGYIPASTGKVPTVMAALDVLGPDYRYRTHLLRDGSIADGVLEGDLYLRGEGDPRFTLADLTRLAERLRVAGVREVAGGFFYDDSALFRAPEIDTGMQVDAAYNPGLSALSIESNTMLANWSKKKNGGIDVLLTPDVPGNRTGTASAPLPKDVKFTFRREERRDVWLISPAIKSRFGGKRLPVKNPARYTAEIFARLCEMRGIRIGQPTFRETPNGATTVAVHTGRPLSELSERILAYSDNLMTELVLLKAAGAISGRKLDLAQAGEVLKQYWSERLPGIAWDSFDMRNGSGLTSASRITPEQMLGILLYAARRRPGDVDFHTMLPISGWRGSLGGRLVYADTALRVYAKTGTINYAVSLAGYLYSRQGRKLAFVVFVNDFGARRAYERDPARLSKPVQKKANKWIRSAKSKIDSLLAEWIRRN